MIVYDIASIRLDLCMTHHVHERKVIIRLILIDVILVVKYSERLVIAQHY